MTVLLDQAIRDLAQSYSVEYPKDEPVEKPIEGETWEEICEYRAYLDRLDYLKCLVEVEKIKAVVNPAAIGNSTENDAGR